MSHTPNQPGGDRESGTRRIRRPRRGGIYSGLMVLTAAALALAVWRLAVL